jgi:hypothetical protein
MAPNELFDRARRAYEWSRLRAALPAALWIAPMMIATLAIGGPQTQLRVGAGVVLAIVVVMFAWRGRAASRAIGPGLVAGLAPLVLPLVMRTMHLCGMHGCLMLCFPACIAGGVIGGLVVALAVRHVSEGRLTFTLATATIAMLCGAMGCLVAGFGGLLGMMIAVATLPVPVLLVRSGNRA